MQQAVVERVLGGELHETRYDRLLLPQPERVLEPGPASYIAGESGIHAALADIEPSALEKAEAERADAAAASGVRQVRTLQVSPAAPSTALPP